MIIKQCDQNCWLSEPTLALRSSFVSARPPVRPGNDIVILVFKPYALRSSMYLPVGVLVQAALAVLACGVDRTKTMGLHFQAGE